MISSGFSHLICGLSGSGKTTIGKLISKSANLEFVDFADLIVNEAGFLGAEIKSHDDIIALSPEILVKSIERARNYCEKIVKSGRRIILESHLGIFVEGIGYRLTNPEILKNRNTLSIIVILPNYKTLVSFRKERSEGRDRIKITKEQDKINRQILVMDASISSAILDIPLIIENNPSKKINYTVNKLVKIIETASKIKKNPKDR